MMADGDRAFSHSFRIASAVPTRNIVTISYKQDVSSCATSVHLQLMHRRKQNGRLQRSRFAEY